MTEEVLRYIKREKLIKKGDLVLAGVSGGADSTCLLLVLEELRRELGFFLEAVHVEHGIRGEESRLDADFVTELCREKEVPCRVYHVDVLDYAKRNGLGLEEAARILRYDCYQKAADETAEKKILPSGQADRMKKVKIALAHHAEDNAETILFQMVRGSGLDGLCGMKPLRQMKEGVSVIRPMLAVSRQEIEAYLEKRGQAYRTDSSNLDTVYSRNKIRYQVLPELLQVNRQAVAHINQSAGLLRELAEYLDGQVEELEKKICIYEESAPEADADRAAMQRGLKRQDVSRQRQVSDTGGTVIIQKKELEKAPGILQRELLHQILKRSAGSAKDITAAHIEAVQQLFLQQVGRRCVLPYGLVAERIYEGVRIAKKPAAEDTAPGFCLEIPQEQLVRAAEGETIFFEIPDGKICMRVLKFKGKMQEISKKSYTKWLDYDKIKGNLQIRNRKSGDYLLIDDAGHKKRLKEYFIDEKIPGSEREKKLLLTSGAHVIWIMGGRISAGMKIDKSTERILEIRISGGKYDED